MYRIGFFVVPDWIVLCCTGLDCSLMYRIGLFFDVLFRWAAHSISTTLSRTGPDPPLHNPLSYEKIVLYIHPCTDLLNMVSCKSVSQELSFPMQLMIISPVVAERRENTLALTFSAI